MANHILPQDRKLTASDLIKYFEEEPPKLIGTMPVRFSETPDFIMADLIERERYKLGPNGDPLPLEFAAEPCEGELYDGLIEAEYLCCDEDLGISDELFEYRPDGFNH